ncbi:MAG: hypothetical protein IIX33_03700, partial [Oscillospiraceae bacterium]|nr:hypothetical protein [Oscillospiraceae bacterium]
ESPDFIGKFFKNPFVFVNICIKFFFIHFKNAPFKKAPLLKGAGICEANDWGILYIMSEEIG